MPNARIPAIREMKINVPGGAVDLRKKFQGYEHRYVLYLICGVTKETVTEMMRTQQAVELATQRGEEVPEQFEFAAGEVMGQRGPACIKCGRLYVIALQEPCPIGDEEFVAANGSEGRVAETWFKSLRHDEENGEEG